MTNRERERQTLNFGTPEGRGTVAETFYPWSLTVERFESEGLPSDMARSGKANDSKEMKIELNEKYLQAKWGEEVMKYEQFLGFDGVKRIHFALPFRSLGDKMADVIGKDKVESMEDWEKLKAYNEIEMAKYFTDEEIKRVYEPLKEGHDKGDYSIRLNIEGFFWVPRELMGVEEHLYAFYDEPELMHDINEYVFQIYSTTLLKVIEIVEPDVLYMMEDLSGKNGPMVSPDSFNEFVAAYYKRLIPLFREKGVGNVFVDTDGDFKQLIPHFMAAGVDGFLPMDVNAGMDIVEVRNLYPTLKFIGSFNKLEIDNGKEAIDKEFERILPVIRGGGYIPGSDHQVAPSASLENYQYYIERLTEVMKECGADLRNS